MSDRPGWLGNLEGWKSKFTPAKEQLEHHLKDVQDWGKCNQCGVPLQSVEHITSKNHYNKIWYKYDELESTEAAEWQQSWKTSSSVVVLNHITAEVSLSGLALDAAVANSSVESASTASALKSSPTSSSSYAQNSNDTLQCNSCKKDLPKEAFHKKQQKWSAEDRICIQCKQHEEEYWDCKECNERKHCTAYPTTKRKDVCTECVERKQDEASHLVCQLCKQRKQVSDFRKKKGLGIS